MAPTGERILVVEDDPDISQLIARDALEPLGYEVTVVGLAATAIDEALENPPDLIIANLDLPDLGGNDLLTAMSSQGITAPTVMVAQRGDELRAAEGANKMERSKENRRRRRIDAGTKNKPPPESTGGGFRQRRRREEHVGGVVDPSPTASYNARTGHGIIKCHS